MNNYSRTRTPIPYMARSPHYSGIHHQRRFTESSYDSFIYNEPYFHSINNPLNFPHQPPVTLTDIHGNTPYTAYNSYYPPPRRPHGSRLSRPSRASQEYRHCGGPTFRPRAYSHSGGSNQQRVYNNMFIHEGSYHFGTWYPPVLSNQIMSIDQENTQTVPQTDTSEAKMSINSVTDGMAECTVNDKICVDDIEVKSDVPTTLDQRESLVKQLSRGRYECVVCCCYIRCDVAVWSCSNCYHVFHLYCVKKWAKMSLDPACVGWRCPTCQNISVGVPTIYSCFCGKKNNPLWDKNYTPHSCGEMCGKQFGEHCPHKCNILCHPGPCPPCTATANQTCSCGRMARRVRCNAFERFQCLEECGEELSCGKHRCTEICHVGECSSCTSVIVQKCYSHLTSREVRCGTIESRNESYSCNEACSTLLSCSNHKCSEPCHSGVCRGCARLPENTSVCSCGKTDIASLDAPKRTSCLDPLVTCGKVCGKPLLCGQKDSGHVCELLCHDGPCPPCTKSMPVICLCRSVTETILCAKALLFDGSNVFKCKKRCKKKRSCGKHKCNQVCCVDNDHICPQLCTRRLSCGQHRCDRLCHSEDCSPCKEVSYSELSCECGAEVIYPPVPCGTKPPPCSHSCTRQHSCDHPVLHPCHSDTKCPPCVTLTSRTCMCGGEIRKNIPCHQIDVSCGLACNKQLPCGQHRCLRICHKDSCLNAKNKCVQRCTLTRELCGHPCNAPCHGKKACPVRTCTTKITLQCVCKNRSASVQCSLSAADPGNKKHHNLTLSLYTMQSGQNLDMGELTAAAKGTLQKLECDSECARLERNKRMAVALQIKNPDLSVKPGSSPYTEFLKDFTKDNQQFVATVEKQFADLVLKAHGSKQVSRSHQFQPMNMNQRKFIHELAPFYGCETQCYDSEPKKNVVLTAFSKKSWLPSLTLTSAIQRLERPPAPIPIPHHSTEADIHKANKEALQSTNVLIESKRVTIRPTFDYFDMTPL